MQLHRTIRALPCIISGWQNVRLGLVLLALSALLAACSAVGLAYRQSTTAIYWWLDAQLDLNDAQSTQVRKELDALYAWHRQNELPRYLTALQRWQTMAPQPLNEEQVCNEFAQVRQAMVSFGEQASPALARLALTLSPEQIEHLAKHQARSNEEHAEESLEGSVQDRFERRVEKLTERYERFYGPLNRAQIQALENSVKQGSYDPKRSFDERLLRQQWLRQVFKQAVALERSQTPGREAQVTAAMKQWVTLVNNSPTPGYQAYASQLTREGCAQLVRIHQTATAEQRAHAVQMLQSYQITLADYVPQD